MMLPVDRSSSETVSIEIESGMSGREIAELLEKEGLVRSSELLYYVMRFKQIDHLKAGYYSLSPADSPYYILDILSRGIEDTFQVTFPEGFIYKEVLNRLAALEKPQFDREKLEVAFNKFAAEVDFKDDPHLADIIVESAEGLIVPDTYKFPMSFDEEQLAGELLETFEEERLPLLKEKAAESEFTAYELLIISSLIEEEGKLEEENEIIASVIYNRLEAGQPLQLDATVQYVLPERKERLLYADLEFESPYNTYQVNKLPPSPIANPGQKAVEAALNPADTDYLFYFAREDGSHIFTKTYQEHLQRQNEAD